MFTENMKVSFFAMSCQYNVDRTCHAVATQTILSRNGGFRQRMSDCPVRLRHHGDEGDLP